MSLQISPTSLLSPGPLRGLVESFARGKPTPSCYPKILVGCPNALSPPQQNCGEGFIIPLEVSELSQGIIPYESITHLMQPPIRG